MTSGTSHQSSCRRITPDSMAEKSSRSSTSRPEPRRLGGDAVQEPLLGIPVPGHVGLHQARRVAADRGQRRAQLVAEPRQEAPLKLARAAQRGGLLMSQRRLLALEREAQRMGGILDQGPLGFGHPKLLPGRRRAPPARRGPGTAPPARWPRPRARSPARRAVVGGAAERALGDSRTPPAMPASGSCPPGPA